MKKFFLRVVSVAIALLCVCGFCGCNDGGISDIGYVPPKATDADALHFSASDTAFADFLNDFAHRHLRYDDYSVADLSGLGFALGSGSGFAKNWETMGLVWHNSVGTTLGSDKQQALKEFLRSITQDDLGMVYNSHNIFLPHNVNLAAYTATGFTMPQGWPIPNIYFSNGKSQAFEFNTDQEMSYWKISGGGTLKKDPSRGYALFTYEGARNEPLRITRETGVRIDTKHAPMLDIELCYNDRNNAIGSGSDVADVSIIFRTEKGGDTWYRCKRSKYASVVSPLTYSYAERAYYSMYLNPDWDGQTVTAIGVEITPKEGCALNLSDGRINYIHPDYDTRQSNPTYQWLLAFGNYVSYTNDNAFLAEMMPKARKAILFLSHALRGEEGLLDIGYFYGHNGIGYTSHNGALVRSAADGVGNGYWDILSTPALNLEANIYYYQALLTMASIEQRAIDAGITAETVTVKNRAVGEECVSYTYTPDSLRSLAAKVKQNVEKDVNPVRLQDGTYTNAGGFYNPVTARFVSGVRPDTGEILDNGYIMWNQEALAAGIGTARQQKRIMEWINGERIVQGDNSTGKDIYLYEFGPRTSTKQNAMNWAGFYDGTTVWSESVQNGGAILCWSYYDLMSRLQIYGADDMFNRFSAISRWYAKVRDAGGEGDRFYSEYYTQLNAYLTRKITDSNAVPYVQLPDYLPENQNPDAFIMQQNMGTNGAIGLDAEFLENIVLITAVPYGLFGMDGTQYNTLRFTNNLPSQLSYLQMENMLYGGTFKYTVRMEKGMLQISDAQGKVPEGAMLALCFKEPKTGYSVKVDGKATDNYTVVNGIITVTVPMGNVSVHVG